MYRTYILDALNRHIRQNPLSAHMPGHKNGSIVLPKLREAWGSEILRYDLTELPGLDNLHAPEGIIAQSQQQAAAIFGVREAHYLINGSTGGLHAALLALSPGEEIFIPRHCHRSVYYGLMLAEARPIYLPVTLDGHWCLPLGVALDDLKAAVRAHPHCRNLLIVNPTYQGITWQNQELLAFAKSQGLNIIVDEAHGAHLHFAPSLPPSLADLDADLVVQSWHKTLPALTGSSCLLVGPNYHGRDIAQTLSVLQSTSPSYLMLTALECASVYMAEQGREDIAASLNEITLLHQALTELATISYLHDETWRADPFKLNLNSSVLSGEELAYELQKQQIYVEMSEANSCLLLLPLKLTAAYRERLTQALSLIDQAGQDRLPRPLSQPFYLRTVPPQKYPLKQALWAPKRTVDLNDALGCASADFILQYPPGIPLAIPGEIITAEMLDLLQAYPQYRQIAVLEE